MSENNIEIINPEFSIEVHDRVYEITISNENHVIQVFDTGAQGIPGDITRIGLITTQKLLISNNAITLPKEPLGDLLFNHAFVYIEDDLVEEHDNLIVDGITARFLDADGELDGKHAVVSFIGLLR